MNRRSTQPETRQATIDRLHAERANLLKAVAHSQEHLRRAEEVLDGADPGWREREGAPTVDPDATVRP